MAVFAVAHRPVEADRIAAHGQHAAGFVDAAFAGAGGLFDASARGRASAAACRETFRTRDMVSTMWTGMRIVRLWSATARVMAWRIHQVA